MPNILGILYLHQRASLSWSITYPLNNLKLCKEEPEFVDIARQGCVQKMQQPYDYSKDGFNDTVHKTCLYVQVVMGFIYIPNS